MSEDRYDAFYFTPKEETFDEQAEHGSAKAQLIATLDDKTESVEVTEILSREEYNERYVEIPPPAAVVAAPEILESQASPLSSPGSLPKPYYEENGIIIYHGDCREVLPSLGIYDLCLTDPPYGINRDGQSSSLTVGIAGGRKNYDAEGWDNERPDGALFKEIFRSSCAQIIWGGNYFVELLKPSMGWLVWDKGQRIDQSDGELAYTSLDEKLRIIIMSRAELNGDGAVHPTQKPVRLMKWCIGLVPWAKSILDPFMGSGSSLLAAKDMGLRACGIEMQEKYCEIAAKRLSQGVLEL